MGGRAEKQKVRGRKHIIVVILNQPKNHDQGTKKSIGGWRSERMKRLASPA